MRNIKVFATTIDTESVELLEKIAINDAFEDATIRVMPDVHAGKGAVIGFTAILHHGRVSPNIVGVDIGCGVLMAEANLDIDTLIKNIENVPAGRKIHPVAIKEFPQLEDLKCIDDIDIDYALRSIGTLGGGNHYIEIDQAEDGKLWVSIHSGSRNLGVLVAKHYMKKAAGSVSNLAERRRQLIQELKACNRAREIQDALMLFNIENKNLTTSDLDYVEEDNLRDYIHDMEITIKYAEMNRLAILEQILGTTDVYKFDTIHNYIEQKLLYDWNTPTTLKGAGDALSPNPANKLIIRKGAIDASLGKLVAIPLNMRDGIVIGVGKGNKDWNYSAPHGAGRILSRSAARKKITIEEFQSSMNGIKSSTVCEATLDEAPMAYKPAKEIIDAITDTVDVIMVVKPIYNYKAVDFS